MILNLIFIPTLSLISLIDVAKCSAGDNPRGVPFHKSVPTVLGKDEYTDDSAKNINYKSVPIMLSKDTCTNTSSCEFFKRSSFLSVFTFNKEFCNLQKFKNTLHKTQTDTDHKYNISYGIACFPLQKDDEKLASIKACEECIKNLATLYEIKSTIYNCDMDNKIKENSSKLGLLEIYTDGEKNFVKLKYKSNGFLGWRRLIRYNYYLLANHKEKVEDKGEIVAVSPDLKVIVPWNQSDGEFEISKAGIKDISGKIKVLLESIKSEKMNYTLTNRAFQSARIKPTLIEYDPNEKKSSPTSIRYFKPPTPAKSKPIALATKLETAESSEDNTGAYFVETECLPLNFINNTTKFHAYNLALIPPEKTKGQDLCCDFHANERILVNVTIKDKKNPNVIGECILTEKPRKRYESSDDILYICKQCMNNCETFIQRILTKMFIFNLSRIHEVKVDGQSYHLITNEFGDILTISSRGWWGNLHALVYDNKGSFALYNLKTNKFSRLDEAFFLSRRHKSLIKTTIRTIEYIEKNFENKVTFIAAIKEAAKSSESEDNNIPTTAKCCVLKVKFERDRESKNPKLVKDQVY